MAAGTGGAIKAGRAYVELFADDSGLVRGLRKAEDRLKRWGSGITALGQKLFIASGLILAPLGAAAKSFADFGSALMDASARTGFAVEDLSALQFAAEQTGSSFEELETGIKFMQKGGFGKTAKDFEKLADQIARIPNPAKQTAKAIAVFGRAGTKLLPILKGGAAGIRDLRREAEDAGIVLSRDDAEAADKLGDAFDKVTTMVKFLFITIGGALAPALQELIADLIPVIKATGKWLKENRGLVVLLFKAAAALLLLSVAIQVIGFLFSGLGVVIGILTTTVGILWGVILSPIGLIVGSIAAVVASFLYLTQQGERTRDALGEAWDNIASTFKAAFGGIMDAINSGDLELAWKIAWLGIKVIAQEAWASLQIGWAEFRDLVIDTWEEIGFGILRAMTTVGSFLEGTWADIIASLASMWADFVLGLQTIWFTLAKAFIVTMTWIHGLIPGQAETAKQVREQSLATLNAQEGQALGQRDQRKQEIEKERLATRAGIDAQQASVDAGIDAERIRLKQARDAARGQEIAGIKADVQPARDELAAAIAEAAAKAAAAAEPLAKVPLSGAPATGAAAGTFSAAAAARGLGSIGILQEQRDWLERIHQAIHEQSQKEDGWAMA